MKNVLSPAHLFFMLPIWPLNLQLTTAVCLAGKGDRPGLRRWKLVLMMLLLTHCVALADSLSP